MSKGRASQALLEAAGEELQDQCEADYPNGLDNDEIAVLDPGNLDCKKVYLITLMKWAGDQEEKVRNCYHCLPSAVYNQTGRIAIETQCMQAVYTRHRS